MLSLWCFTSYAQIGGHLFQRSNDGTVGISLMRKLGSIVRLRPGLSTKEYDKKIGVKVKDSLAQGDSRL